MDGGRYFTIKQIKDHQAHSADFITMKNAKQESPHEPLETAELRGFISGIIQKNANGWYTGQCEQIPEAISQGETLEEVKENMADAIKMVIDYKKEETRKQYIGKRIFRRRIAVLWNDNYSYNI